MGPACHAGKAARGTLAGCSTIDPLYHAWSSNLESLRLGCFEVTLRPAVLDGGMQARDQRETWWLWDTPRLQAALQKGLDRAERRMPDDLEMHRLEAMEIELARRETLRDMRN